MRMGFGEFCLDSETRRLEQRGQPVHLTPKAFRLLEILLEERPRAMAKVELCDRLWPDVIVDEGNLANLVAEIRSALSNAGGDPDVIRTVRRFGYAFAGNAAPLGRPMTEDTEASRFRLLVGDRRIPLKQGLNLLGRGYDSVVPLQPRGISRRHAQITVAGNIAVLEDLGSRNGTFVGATRISAPVELRAGDRISLGSELVGTLEILPAPDSTITERQTPSTDERELR